MLRNTLLLTAGLILLPISACAQEAATPIKSASAAQVSYGSGTAAPQNEMKKDVMSTSIHAAWTDILKTCPMILGVCLIFMFIRVRTASLI